MRGMLRYVLHILNVLCNFLRCIYFPPQKEHSYCCGIRINVSTLFVVALMILLTDPAGGDASFRNSSMNSDIWCSDVSQLTEACL